MIERLASLGAYNYFIAAVMAFFVTYIILRISGIRKILNERDELEMDIKNVDKRSVMERCAKMFPIDTMVFNGSEFKKA